MPPLEVLALTNTHPGPKACVVRVVTRTGELRTRPVELRLVLHVHLHDNIRALGWKRRHVNNPAGGVSGCRRRKTGEGGAEVRHGGAGPPGH